MAIDAGVLCDKMNEITHCRYFDNIIVGKILFAFVSVHQMAPPLTQVTDI